MFSATFRHEITLYAIDIDKKRSRTPFLTLQNLFENRPSTILNFLEHLQLSHIPEKNNAVKPFYKVLNESFQDKMIYRRQDITGIVIIFLIIEKNYQGLKTSQGKDVIIQEYRK